MGGENHLLATHEEVLFEEWQYNPARFRYIGKQPE
ncbi:Uncharacterised protein [Streptococcus pneumoniae]|nr:Uncharacterised protein [Streptococcus pneumoniae]